jgi:hypothetical protein
MDKRKTGIALLITLMVIASIMSILAVSFSYLEKVKKDAGVTSALIQANILYGNTLEVLKRFFPAKADNTNKLAIIYSMPLMINEEKNGFSMNLSCHPLIAAVPINWLDSEDTSIISEKNTLAKDVLSYIVEAYSIQDPNELEELLLQSIRGKQIVAEEYTKRLKRQKSIVSKQQFDSIITDYALKYDDINALKVPWDKYFIFLKVNKKTKIDGVYPSAEFVSAAFDIPIEIVKNGWDRDINNNVGTSNTTLSSFLRDNGYAQPNKNIFSKKALNAMHCEQTFAYKDKQYGFKFNYIEGRSINFEFNGQE